jgi:hypothetical protein
MEGDMKEIPLSCFGKYKGQFVAIVDDADFDKLSKYKWSVVAAYKTNSRTIRYAARIEYRDNGSRKTIYMHHDIAGRKEGLVTDHIDGDGLNNSRSNLRLVTVKENAENNYIRRSIF